MFDFSGRYASMIPNNLYKELAMSEKQLNMHYVCTLDEAREIAKGVERFWVSTCGCRGDDLEKNKCKRSEHDVCVSFYEGPASMGTNLREITRDELEGLFKLSKTAPLVPRPFRGYDEATKTVLPETAGFCFCCDCCCGYFLGDDYECDKGKMIESTDYDNCSACGACVDVCFFKARAMDGDSLQVNQDKCYGCGVCVDFCPTGCIKMVNR